MLSLIAILVAGFFKSVADTCAHHYSVSVFKKRSRQFWDNSDSWYTSPDFKPAKRIFKFPVTAWHIANSLMICSFIVAAVLYGPINLAIGSFSLSIWGGYSVLVDGFAFIGVFNLFYNRLLRR